MKKRKSITLALVIAGSSLVTVLPHVASANIGQDVGAAIQAMRKKSYAEAKVIYDRIMKNHGENGARLHGPKFGNLYYDKGYCELSFAKTLLSSSNEKDLNKAEELLGEAKESFEACRKIKGKENIYRTKSLLYTGEADQHLKKFAEAITSYKKFLDERDKKEIKDKYHIGMYHINMAICHFKLEKPNIKGGLRYYEKALKNKDKMRVPDAAIVTAFKDFAAATIFQKKEAMLVKFVNENRGVLTLDPYKMYQFIPSFRKYAAEAFSQDMLGATFALYGLMPGTKEAFEDLSVFDQDLAGYTRPLVKDGYINPNAMQSVIRIQNDLKHISKSIDAGEPHELLAMLSLAATHEGEGYTRGAYNAFKSLEKYYKKSKRREANLYNLVRTSSAVGEVMETEKYGRLFLEKFPTSQYAGAVKNMMLISLFYTGEYEVAFKVATELMPTLAEKTEQHDLCLHVYGGSMFYLGRFFEADPYLKKHVKMYKDSKYKIAARYFAASNYTRLENWEKAATELDRFMSDYPDASTNDYIPFALYDRANTHFSLEELEESVAALDKLEKKFPSSAVESVAFLLRGDVHRAKKEKDLSHEYYIKGLELSKRQGADIVSEEALYKLVALHGVKTVNKEPNPKIQDAIPYYDEFWKERQSSPYKTELAVAGVPALKAAGRGKEALANLQSVLSEMAKKENAPGLEEAINSYGKLYLEEGYTPEQLKTHFERFPDVDAGDKRTQALLRIAIIGVYEDIIANLEKAGGEDAQEEVDLLRIKIQVIFGDMDKKFKKSELSDFILIRLGNFIAERTGNPRKALPYYDEILGRNSKKFRVKAQFGRAGILAKSTNATEQNQALETLKDVLATKDIDSKTEEKATYNLVEVYAQKESWKNVIKYATSYNKAKYAKNKQAEVAFMLARGYEADGNVSKATSTYTAVYGRYKSRWEISIPALKKAAILTKKNGKEVQGTSAKQIAYNMVANFVRSSTKAYEANKVKMPTDVRKSWEEMRDLSKSWESEPGIKSLKRQRKEKGLEG